MQGRSIFVPAALAGLLVAGSVFAQQGETPAPVPGGQPAPAPAPIPQQLPQPLQQLPQQAPQTPVPAAPPEAQPSIPIRTIIGYGVGQNCQYDASFDGVLTATAGGQAQAPGAQAGPQLYTSRVKIRAAVTCPNQPAQRSNETVTTGALPLAQIEQTLALRGAVIAPGQVGRRCLYMPIVALSPQGLTGAGIEAMCPVGGGPAMGGGPAGGQSGGAPPGTAQPPVQAPPSAAPAPATGDDPDGGT